MYNTAVLILSVVVVSTLSCDVGWTKHDGECLYFSHDRATWPNAESSCRLKHGSAYLVTVDNAAKEKYIDNFASVLHHFREQSFWLGSSDFAIEGSWRWIETGTGFTDYTNWAPGFPDGNRTHNCLLLKYFGTTPMWVDYNCNSKQYYICEKPDPNAMMTTPSVIG